MKEPIRSLVVGGGAMGSVYASHLAESGSQVALLDTNPELVQAIERDGLWIDDKEGARSVEIPIVSSADGMDVPDIVYVFVKAHHTRSAAEGFSSLVGNKTTVVTLQNGWGNADILAEYCDPERLVIGITYNSSTLKRPGYVLHTGAGETTVGTYLETADRAIADTVAMELSTAGLPTQSLVTIKTEIWKKLTLNAAALPVSALTRLVAGRIAAPSPVNPLVEALAREATKVGQALGFDIDPDERIQTIQQVLERAGDGKASMLQDVEAESKTEIEVVCGAVVAEGERLEVAVPLNKAMVGLIHGLEMGWQR